MKDMLHNEKCKHGDKIMSGMKSRDRFLNHNFDNKKSYNIFDEILKTDMDYSPDTENDIDGDLSRKILQDDYVMKYFLNNRPESTQSTYFNIIYQFCLFNCMQPAQLIKEALQDKNDIELQRAYVARIQHFFDFLNENGYSIEHSNGEIEYKEYASKTLHTKISPIISFYTKFGISIPKIISENLPTNEAKKENEYHFTREELIDILKYTELLSRAIVLAQTSSGLSGVDVRSLTIGDYVNGKKTIKKSVINDDGSKSLEDVTFCMLVVKRQKMRTRGGKEFVTFFSPEACEAIDAYLNYRNTPTSSANRTQRLAFEKRRYDIDLENGKSVDELYLFIKKDLGKKFLEDRDDELRQMSRYNLLHLYNSLSTKCGQSTEAYLYNYIRSHNMRKFFGNTLENNTTKSNFVRFMMGHKEDSIDSAYYTPLQDKLQDFYIDECLPLIQFRETETIRFADADRMRLLELEKLVKASIVRENVSIRAEEKASNATSFAEKIKFKSIANKYQTHAENAQFMQRKLFKNQDLTEDDEEALLRNFDKGNPVNEDKEDVNRSVLFNKHVQPVLESEDFEKVSKEIKEEYDDGFKEIEEEKIDEISESDDEN